MKNVSRKLSNLEKENVTHGKKNINHTVNRGEQKKATDLYRNQDNTMDLHKNFLNQENILYYHV